MGQLTPLRCLLQSPCETRIWPNVILVLNIHGSEKSRLIPCVFTYRTETLVAPLIRNSVISTDAGTRSLVEVLAHGTLI